MNTIKKQIILKIGNKGYALLFAVLVSAIVLGVGVSILNISRKELLLTSGGEQSQYAFYAADAGYECALYQDYQNQAFTSTTTGSNAFNVYCGSTYVSSAPATYASPVTVTNPTSGVGFNVYQYAFNVPVSKAGSCAAVLITKTLTTVGTSTTVATNVLSDGFNVGWESAPGDCNAPNNTKEERALVANY